MAVDVLSVTLRALSFIAMFQAAGAALFVALFAAPLTATAGAIRRIAVISAIAGALFASAHYALEAARMSGDFAGVADASLQALVFHSSISTALALRLAGLALVAGGLCTPRLSHSGVVLAIAGVLLIVGAFATVGHTTTHPEHGLSRVVLIAHLLAVAFWFGALIPLGLVSARESSAVAGEVIDAFSRLAAIIVPGLLLAGLTLAVFLSGSLAVLRTPYGRILLGKVAGFALLMVPAALNKWRLGPAIARGDARAALTFRRSLAIEYVLIAAVLALTAILTTFFAPDET